MTMHRVPVDFHKTTSFMKDINGVTITSLLSNPLFVLRVTTKNMGMALPVGK
jgi:hypothetical protein